MAGHQSCEPGGCSEHASVLDTQLGKLLCSEHRRWPCPSCGVDHRYLDLSTYNDDSERYIHCPRNFTVLASWYHTPYAAFGRGYEFSQLCSTCMGIGRCRCTVDLVGSHERCLFCSGTHKCHHCTGTGLAATNST